MVSTLARKWTKYGPTEDPTINARFHLKRFNYYFTEPGVATIHPPLGFEAGKEELSAITYLTSEGGYVYFGTPEVLPTDTRYEDRQRPIPGQAPASRS